MGYYNNKEECEVQDYCTDLGLQLDRYSPTKVSNGNRIMQDVLFKRFQDYKRGLTYQPYKSLLKLPCIEILEVKFKRLGFKI